jgi:hypothetical protein
VAVGLAVVGTVNGARTQNGHIRNDTRDALRRILSVSKLAIYRRKCVASDRACTRVPPLNFHGKEGVDGSSPSEGSRRQKIPGNRGFLLSRLALQSTSRCRLDRLVGLAAQSETAANRPVAWLHRAPPWWGGARRCGRGRKAWKVPGKKDICDHAAGAHESWGQVLGTGGSSLGGAAA